MASTHTTGEIRELANQVLEDSGYSGQFPVPIDKIIKKKGYNFKGINKEYVPPDFSGMVDYKKKLVVVNSSHSNGRKRFTAAHELGHIVLHPHESKIDFRFDFTNSTPKETEANCFAAEILMPYDTFLEIYELYKGDLRFIADYFDVSIGAVTIRTETIKNEVGQLVHG